eukprot:gene15752-18716_t
MQSPLPADNSHVKSAIDGNLYEYLVKKSVKLHPVQVELVECELTSLDQCQFFQFLVKSMNIVNAIDIGVFTGMSSLAVALALPENGKLLACDVSDEYTQHARKYWEKAGVSNIVELILQPAALTLQKLLDDGKEGTFDFIFIDADKVSYDTYFELGLRLIRKGGIIAFDNVLQQGRVIDARAIAGSADTQAIVNLNDKIFADPRVFMCMLPIADGITMVTKA